MITGRRALLASTAYFKCPQNLSRAGWHRDASRDAGGGLRCDCPPKTETWPSSKTGYLTHRANRLSPTSIDASDSCLYVIRQMRSTSSFGIVSA
jgi:hypothetical protein